MAVHHITLLAVVAVLGAFAAARCPSFNTSLYCKFGYRTRRGCPVSICNPPPYGTTSQPTGLGCPGAEQGVVIIDPPNPLVPACSPTNPCLSGQICSSECNLGIPNSAPTVCIQAVLQEFTIPPNPTTPPPSVGCPRPNDPLPTLGSCSNSDPCEKGQICSSNCRELGIPGFANGGGVCLRGVPLPPRY